MKKTGQDITSYFGSPTKCLNLCEESTSEAQVRPDISVHTESSAAEGVWYRYCGVFSCGATSDCNKLSLIKFRTPEAHISMPSRQYLDNRRTSRARQWFRNRE